ncbi:MAG: cytidylate kinase-like family protein [Anaerolineae bacterium]|nr:cytidylate kinase-like family protein [Anaerolineae bacterium]
MATVTISRQLGSGGNEIAAGVAEALGLRFIDREMIKRAAHEAGVPKGALQEMEYEGQRTVVEQVLDILRQMPSIPNPPETALRETATPLSVHFGGIFSPTLRPMGTAMDDYVRIVGMVIRDLAREGGVIIVGRGSQVLLKDHPAALHVQIIAPFRHRVKTVMESEGLERRAAVSRVRTSDRARVDYLRRYHNVNWLDPQLYDLVISTAKVPVEVAVELIVEASRALRANVAH